VVEVGVGRPLWVRMWERGVEVGRRIPTTEVDFHSRGLISSEACPWALSPETMRELRPSETRRTLPLELHMDEIETCTGNRPCHTHISSRAGVPRELVDRAW